MIVNLGFVNDLVSWLMVKVWLGQVVSDQVSLVNDLMIVYWCIEISMYAELMELDLWLGCFICAWLRLCMYDN